MDQINVETATLENGKDLFDASDNVFRASFVCNTGGFLIAFTDAVES